MTKEVMISIQGFQFAEENESDNVELITAGEYYYKNGKHYILYDEVDEESGRVTKNRVKFQQDYLELTKKGAAESHMIFEKNKKNVTYYHTPFGSLLVGVDASSVDIEESEELIKVHAIYDLDANYEHVAQCEITICVRPKGSRPTLVS